MGRSFPCGVYVIGKIKSVLKITDFEIKRQNPASGQKWSFAGFLRYFDFKIWTNSETLMGQRVTTIQGSIALNPVWTRGYSFLLLTISTLPPAEYKLESCCHTR
jgi:hypothetical protein